MKVLVRFMELWGIKQYGVSNQMIVFDSPLEFVVVVAVAVCSSRAANALAGPEQSWRLRSATRLAQWPPPRVELTGSRFELLRVTLQKCKSIFGSVRN